MGLLNSRIQFLVFRAKFQVRKSRIFRHGKGLPIALCSHGQMESHRFRGVHRSVKRERPPRRIRCWLDFPAERVARNEHLDWNWAAVCSGWVSTSKRRPNNPGHFSWRVKMARCLMNSIWKNTTKMGMPLESWTLRFRRNTFRMRQNLVWRELIRRAAIGWWCSCTALSSNATFGWPIWFRTIQSDKFHWMSIIPFPRGRC